MITKQEKENKEVAEIKCHRCRKVMTKGPEGFKCPKCNYTNKPEKLRLQSMEREAVTPSGIVHVCQPCKIH